VRTYPEGISFAGQTLQDSEPGSAAAVTISVVVIASLSGWLVATAPQPRATPHQSGRTPASRWIPAR
jgi:hypothetical protein